MTTQQTGYYRFPTIHGNRVLFVCEDDLWSVSSSGGAAMRLTANLGAVAYPVLSPDGSRIAFIGRDEGHTEVYVMPAAGGNAKRLTFLGAQTSTVGWSPDGQSIIFASNTSQPFFRLMQLYSISAEGGLPQLLPYGMANEIAFGANGGVVLGRNIAEPSYWKRYRGGRTGVLWIDATGDGLFEKLLDLPGNFASPMWIRDRIYFVSDHEGVGNLYSCTPAGQDIQQLTHHRDFYVRNAKTDGQRIVYHAGAKLFCFDVATSTGQAIPVEFCSPQVQRQRKFIKAGDYLEDYELHPAGHSTLITSRGQSFCFGNWEGAVMSLGQTNEVGRYRLARWLHDDSQFVAICDRSGTETLEILSADFDTAPISLTGLDLGRAIDLEVSPVANQVVLSNHRHELIWVDLDSQQSRVLDHSPYSRIHGFSWSPDGQWIAYGYSTTPYTACIKLCQITSGQTVPITASRFRDFAPTFDPEGKFIYFLSDREFKPVYDSLYFDLGFPEATRPFLISLQKETLSPFVPKPKPLTEKNGEAAKDQPTHDNSAEAASVRDRSPEPITIDVEGIEQRILGFPVAEGRYLQIWGLKGKVLFSSVPIKGDLGWRWDSNKLAAAAKIELYDFAEQTCKPVAHKITDFKVARDHKTLIYRSSDRLRVQIVKALDPQHERHHDSHEAHSSKPSRKTGWLDLKRVRISIQPQQEWQQMFREIWRLQQEHFWTPDFSGVDWHHVYQRYRPLLDQVATRAEFSDLIWEMQGELGTSHAYEIGGDYRKEPDYYLGFLGADFTYDAAAEAYRISHIAQGDTWTDQASPLQAIGLNVQAGDLLLAINGQPLTQHIPPHARLIHQADCPVQLTVANRDGQNRRTLTVKTLKNEQQLRYRAWVERNHQIVTEATAGQIGYLHIPDMGVTGYAEFHRYYFAEVHKQGLVVDVRFNRGGHVSQLLLEKLARQRIGYSVSRWEQPEPYPTDSMLGPIVAVTNEHAGSDGDIFSHCFKLMKIGQLIGTRTWGGVIGIWPRHRLVDLSLVTQPEYSFWFEDVGWRVENYGTDPDIHVEIPPHDWAQGNDPQLNTAIQLILESLGQNPVQIPDFADRPRLPLPL